MSVVPDSSLRQQLEAAAVGAIEQAQDGMGCMSFNEEARHFAAAAVVAIWPLIEAALLAARVGTLTQIAEKIEAQSVSGMPYAAAEYNSAIDRCAEIARSVGTETDG